MIYSLALWMWLSNIVFAVY